MKVAITSQGKELSSEIDLRFGRAKWFMVMDTDYLRVCQRVKVCDIFRKPDPYDWLFGGTFPFISNHVFSDLLQEK